MVHVAGFVRTTGTGGSIGHRPRNLAGGDTWSPQNKFKMAIIEKTRKSSISVSITSLRHRVNVNTLEHLAARTLELNEIAICNISLDRPIPFAPYAECRALGSFIVIDRVSNETVGLGLIDFALHRASNIHWQPLAVGREARALQKRQRPCVLWFTGLSGSGKSTIANALEALQIGRAHV